MKTLFILRHAKAEVGGGGIQDVDRALTQRGQNDARALGELMVQESVHIDQIVCSVATRTRQTATLMNEATLPNPIPIDYSEALYLAESDDILSYLQSLNDSASNVILVGHNPGIHQFCLSVATQGKSSLLRDMAMRFPTCAMATIELPIHYWHELAYGTGKLIDFVDRHMTGERLD